MEEKFEQYSALRDEIFKYFNYQSYDLGVEFYLNAKWYDDENQVYWLENDEEYSEEIWGTSKFSGENYTLFVLHLSTGGRGINIFKNDNYGEFES